MTPRRPFLFLSAAALSAVLAAPTVQGADRFADYDYGTPNAPGTYGSASPGVSQSGSGSSATVELGPGPARFGGVPEGAERYSDPGVPGHPGQPGLAGNSPGVSQSGTGSAATNFVGQAPRFGSAPGLFVRHDDPPGSAYSTSSTFGSGPGVSQSGVGSDATNFVSPSGPRFGGGPQGW